MLHCCDTRLDTSDLSWRSVSPSPSSSLPPSRKPPHTPFPLEAKNLPCFFVWILPTYFWFIMLIPFYFWVSLHLTSALVGIRRWRWCLKKEEKIKEDSSMIVKKMKSARNQKIVQVECNYACMDSGATRKKLMYRKVYMYWWLFTCLFNNLLTRLHTFF